MFGSNMTCRKGHERTPENCRKEKDGAIRCLVCARDYNKVWERSNRRERNEYTRNRNLQTNYGISCELYTKMYDSQNGLCAICHLPETTTRKGKLRMLCVDHNHTTGEVRSLLCSRCNIAVGYLDDSPERAKALAGYLERFRG